MSDEHHAKGDPAKFDSLNARLKAMSPDESLLVASAFSNLLSLHNLSEEARPMPHSAVWPFLVDVARPRVPRAEVTTDIRLTVHTPVGLLLVPAMTGSCTRVCLALFADRWQSLQSFLCYCADRWLSPWEYNSANERASVLRIVLRGSHIGSIYVPKWRRSFLNSQVPPSARLRPPLSPGGEQPARAPPASRRRACRPGEVDQRHL